jgi:protein-S-isoprenylcysteine O-methyltransferase Ste14
MTVTHLVFAFATTAYILVAIRFEEHDLVESLGDDYRKYRERVPMIIPWPRKHRRTASVPASR